MSRPTKVRKIHTGKLGRAGSGNPRPGPSKMDHAKFIVKSRYTTTDLDLLLQDISCKTISDDSKLSIMQQAVAPCTEININIKGKSTTSLLDSGSVVTLMNESYFKEHIEHRLSPSSGMYNNSHNLFNLKGVEEGHVPLTRHFECNIEVGGQTVHRVGILVKKDRVPLVDSKGKNAKTQVLLVVTSSVLRSTNSAKHMAKNVFVCLNVLQILVLFGFPHYASIILPTSLKKQG